MAKRISEQTSKPIMFIKRTDPQKFLRFRSFNYEPPTLVAINLMNLFTKQEKITKLINNFAEGCLKLFTDFMLVGKTTFPILILFKNVEQEKDRPSCVAEIRRNHKICFEGDIAVTATSPAQVEKKLKELLALRKLIEIDTDNCNYIAQVRNS